MGAASLSLNPAPAAGQIASVDEGMPIPVVPFYHRTVPFEELAQFGVESNENWGAVQGPTGRVFVANGRGVLVYDGADWKVVTTPNTTAVRSVAVGPANRVYAGAQGEFGYLVPDSTSYRFVSLSDLVPAEDAAFGNVWTIRADGDRVYFQAANHLFEWDGSKLTTVHSESGFHTSFLTEEGLILRERGVGLVRYENGHTTLIPGGDFFAEMRVFVLQPRAQGWFIGTRDNGFYTMSGEQITPFPTEADDLLQDYWLYTSVQAPSGELILGTLGTGLIGMDAQGRVTSRVTDETGLPDLKITSLSPIRPAGYLATTQNNGLFFFESPGVLSSYGERELDAAGHLYIYGDTLFVSSGSGLETIRLDTPGAPTRRILDKTSYQVQGVGDLIYVGTDYGVEIRREGVPPDTLLNGQQIMTLAAYRDGVVVGSRSGISVISGTTVRRQYRVEDVRSVAVSGDDIWFATLSAGLHRLREAGGGWKRDSFAEADGLPAHDRLEVVSLGGSIRVFSDDHGGVYRLAGASFVRDEDLTPVAERDEVWNLAESPDGTVWIGYADRIERAIPTRSGYILEASPTLRFERSRSSALFADDQGGLWYNRDSRVARYHPQVDGEHGHGYEVVLREVRTDAGTELFPTEAVPGGFRVTRELPFAQNDVRFRYASAVPTERLEYSWRIDGEGWGPWSEATEALVKGLHEGQYTFEVRARDHHATVSRTARATFTVLPPWYRSLVAYLVYAALALAFCWFVYRYQVMVRAQKRAAEQARELEREKIYRKKLEGANTRLRQANKLKDEFLAKTSHELRTPLTAILGFTGILRDEIPDDKPYREFVEIIEESGVRLMGTLDDLLEVASLRAGTRETAPEEINVMETLERVIGPIQTRAGERGLYVRLKGAPDALVITDPTGFEKILHNLLDNAVKFTNEGGINVAVSLTGTCTCPCDCGDSCSCERSQQSCVEISVADTGIGIDERFIPHLFDEFNQESEGENRSHNGTGLGLAIAGGLVELLGGEIEVQSEKEKGSTFTVRLPVRTVGFAADERHGPAQDRPAVAGASADRGSAAGPGASTDRPPERRDPRRTSKGPGEKA